MNLVDQISEAKKSFYKMASLTTDQKNQALHHLVGLLKKNLKEISQANAKDIEENEHKISKSLFQRLILNTEKIESLCLGVEDVAGLPDPAGKILEKKTLANGLLLQKVSVPIGLIGVVFESRPEAMIQILSLILKSGNAAILKGGKEAHHTNLAIARVFSQLSKEIPFLPAHWATLISSREEVYEMLKHDDLIDLVIPRGSNELVRAVMNATKIPVLGHADGICHIFVDEVYDSSFAIPVIMDAKTQYPAACNAVETVLIHENLKNTLLKDLLKAFSNNNVQVYGCEQVRQIDQTIGAVDTWSKEYSDKMVSVKLVSGVEEAISHINTYGSHHTDSIISENTDHQKLFFSNVDSAGVYSNVSTRFADGFRYGMGAEVGISTSKTHARGPVGLDGLVTYKYLLQGQGHKVGP